MTKRVVVSALCCALWVLTTGCGDECTDAFDCRNDNGQPPQGQEWVCNADNKCEQRPLATPAEDAGTDAGTGEEDSGTPVDAGTDAGMPVDAGTDAGTMMEDAGTDAGSMSVPKGEACVSSMDCQQGLRCEGTPSLCQAMYVAVTATADTGGEPHALIMRYDTPGMVPLTDTGTSSRYPRWGPSGARIAFAQDSVETGTNSGNKAGELVLRDVPLVENQATVLADGGTGSTEQFRYMEWEPGPSILYVRRAGGSSSGISLVPTDGGSVAEATQSGTFPDWAGDGKSFAFSTATLGLSVLTVGGATTPIASSGETAEQPHYNRTNNQLLFLRKDATKPAGFDTSLFLVPVTGGTVQMIADFTTESATGGSIDSYIANPIWSPDGTLAAYVRAYFFNPTSGTPELCGGGSTPCAGRPGNIIFVRRINSATGEGAAAEASFVEGGTLPSFSPDGRFLAYVKGGQLYIQQIDPATGLPASGVDAIVHPKGGFTIQTSAGDDHRPRWQPK
ncbi:PD40 domain-containing protein [Pyxidicoccus parkwayensis]|uniref:PD40 domain-containing protein n=1 Tax=Pyxidicoccus parkwayensis TaxID=2813578 RepID=A0ABX7NLU6_9BACT|nr:PD40 domain-containing protein [Pyxidicoccus parkwaysis]QSQ19363.1 PD40 domain-containing protein [Pyxidicoccus parkwaysis]